jgi:hypothetical protein
VLGLSLTAAAFLVACSLNRDHGRSVDILSRTVITGSVNGSPFEGSVSATFNTGAGEVRRASSPNFRRVSRRAPSIPTLESLITRVLV